MTLIRWLLLRVAELLAAVVLVYFLTSYLTRQEHARFDAIPATEWFEVIEIYVPDHEEGANPRVVYDRVIKEDFQGFWLAEVQRRDDTAARPGFFAACSGSGSNSYETTDWLDPDLVTWEWFLGRPCKVAPGTYRIVVTYDMKLPGGNRVKRYRALSNIFHVYPKGELPPVYAR